MGLFADLPLLSRQATALRLPAMTPWAIGLHGSYQSALDSFHFLCFMRRPGPGREKPRTVLRSQ